MASFVGKSLRRPATGDKVSNGDSAKWRNMQLIKKQKEKSIQWRYCNGAQRLAMMTIGREGPSAMRTNGEELLWNITKRQRR